MKKCILLILNLCIATLSYSQISYPRILSDSTVEITNTQLKQANKLFTEGEQYKNLYRESCNQIDRYQIMINNYSQIDSLQTSNIENLTNALDASKKNNKKLTTVNHFLTGSTVGLAIISLLVLLFK